MFRKIFKGLAVGLLATVVVVGSFAVWAYFTQKKIDAREQEFLDRRYPVHAGRPKAKPVLAPLPPREGLPAGTSRVPALPPAE